MSEVVVREFGAVDSLALDETFRSLYWPDTTVDHIMATSYDQDKPVVTIVTGLSFVSGPKGIVIDTSYSGGYVSYSLQ